MCFLSHSPMSHFTLTTPLVFPWVLRLTLSPALLDLPAPPHWRCRTGFAVSGRTDRELGWSRRQPSSEKGSLLMTRGVEFLWLSQINENISDSLGYWEVINIQLSNTDGVLFQITFCWTPCIHDMYVDLKLCTTLTVKNNRTLKSQAYLALLLHSMPTCTKYLCMLSPNPNLSCPSSFFPRPFPFFSWHNILQSTARSTVMIRHAKITH